MSNIFNDWNIIIKNNDEYSSIQIIYNNSYYVNFAINKEVENNEVIKKNNQISKVKKSKNKAKQIK